MQQFSGHARLTYSCTTMLRREETSRENNGRFPEGNPPTPKDSPSNQVFRGLPPNGVRPKNQANRLKLSWKSTRFQYQQQPLSGKLKLPSSGDFSSRRFSSSEMQHNNVQTALAQRDRDKIQKFMIVSRFILHWFLIGLGSLL